jgi:ABC-type transporter Mla maintaining outer membrane lipid asymmetry ATPase subunit MlaF
VNRLKQTAGITGILTSHDMSATLRCADRIAMIRDARIVFSGTADEAARDPEVKRFMAGEG